MEMVLLVYTNDCHPPAGQFWYTLFNGGELHPRTGALFDWKHFNASRSGGILLWTLMYVSSSLSFPSSHVMTGPSCEGKACALWLHFFLSGTLKTNSHQSDLSFAAWQYERFGYLTNSMILAVALRVGVVWDYFNVEHW